MPIAPPSAAGARPGPIVHLQTRLVRSFLLTGGALVVLMTALTLGLTGRMVDAVEAREAKRSWERVATAERAQADTLRTLVDGYAYSNAMAAFSEGEDPAYDAATLGPWFLGNADIDGVLVFAPDDRVRLADAVVDRQREPLPALIVAAVRGLREIERVRSSGDSAVAWARLAGEWHQLAIGAVGREGEPPNGALVVLLRRIDADTLAARAVEAQARYTLAPFDPSVPPVALGPSAARIAVPLEDPVAGTTAMAVAETPYELSAVLRQIQLVMVAQQSLLLAATLVALIWLLKRQVLDRVQSLRREVDAMRHGAGRRAEVPGPRDELTLLGEEFGALYGALDSAKTEWRQAALRDPLTGLGNRAALQARLDVLLAAGRRWPAALHLLDLDGFKAINDVHGHATGDALLVALSRGLTEALGERADVFRLGGDEYAILANHGDDLGPDILAAVARVRVLDAAGMALGLRASIGRAALAEDLATPGDWLRRADIAMYVAKRGGGGHVLDFEPSMHEALVDRESIERRLRRTLEANAIDVAFQPIVSALDGRLTAVEALARWNDAERGRVPPSRFVPVAEEAGLSAELDLQVLAKALPVLVELRMRAPEVVLQVNLAPPSLLTPGIVERIDDALRVAGVAHAALLLEVTESALAADPDAVAAVIARLRDRGLRIALDDFGTGYSSMARLAELKPTALKIDGQFVRDFDGDGDRIIRSILGLAKAFGLHATAEFVETEAQRAYLRGLGCDAVQGYGIAEPMPGGRLLEWVRDAHHRDSASTSIGTPTP